MNPQFNTDQQFEEPEDDALLQKYQAQQYGQSLELKDLAKDNGYFDWRIKIL